MALDAGTVRITVSYGKDLRDTDWFKKGDPYALLACGNHSFRTRTAHRAGSSPVWNEVFSFPVINENVIQMTIKDEDMIGRDDLIGCCTISLARAREQGSDMQQVGALGCGWRGPVVRGWGRARRGEGRGRGVEQAGRDANGNRGGGQGGG